MCKKCNNLERRVEALEKIITPHSITLINKQDPTEKVVLECDGEFRSKKLKTILAEEELGSTNGF
jgi:hypothetical protein